MRQAIALALVLTGCAGDGESEMSSTIETQPFVPVLCTTGTSCPTNQVSLEDAGVAATFQFSASGLGSGLYLTNVTFVGGARGLYAEDPMLLVWNGAATEGMPTTTFADVINVPPNTSQAVAESTALVGDATMRISLRFTVLQPYRP